MTYDVYQDWIIIDGRHYWTDHPRWARIAPGWVTVAPSRCPNQHLGLYPASILDPDGPALHELRPIPIGDGLRLSSPHLWVGTIADELTDEDIKTTRFGCTASLNADIHGSLLVDGNDLDFSDRIA